MLLELRNVFLFPDYHPFQTLVPKVDFVKYNKRIMIMCLESSFLKKIK